ncbi:Mss4-like protein [Ustulina deusta]|nr:Mss4-like protein [Ustulina deusta]
MSVRTASCLCGGIKIEIRGTPFMQNLCHCSSCQKSTGAPFGSLAAYKTEQVTFTESEPSVLKTYIDTSPESGGVLKRSFCGKCGSPVGIQRGSNPDTLVLPIGIIDGNKDAFKPQLEFFCRSKADWVGAIQDSKTFDAMPPTNPPQ